MICTHCRKEIDEKYLVHVDCGGIAKDNTSFVTVLLLCIFLGFIGAHRFYTGNTGTGATQLVLTLTVLGSFITGIWVLVDIIMIVSGNFTTADGKNLVRV